MGGEGYESNTKPTWIDKAVWKAVVVKRTHQRVIDVTKNLHGPFLETLHDERGHARTSRKQGRALTYTEE